MPNDIRRQKRVRASLRGVLTRTENILISKTELSTEEVETRLENLRENFQKFQELQAEIELETDQGELEEETQYRYEFEELYTSLKCKLLTMRKNNEITTQPATTIDYASCVNLAQQEYYPKLNFQPLQDTESFENFIKRLTLFFIMNRVMDPKARVHTLLATLSPELHQKIYDLCSPEDPLNKEFDELSDILGEYIDPKPSVWHLQHKFISRMQQPTEPVATYAAELKRLCSNCEFKCQHCKKSTSDNFLSLQLIRGLQDGEIRSRILQDRDTPPFSKLVQIATSIEMGKAENCTMATEIKRNTDGINKISLTNRPTFQPSPTNSKKRPSLTIKDLKGKCFRCGKTDHRANECGAIKSVCRKCQKEGHLARVCLQRNINTNQVDDTSSNISVESIGEINMIKSEIQERYLVSLSIENKKVQMEFDTGAALSSMSLNQYQKLKIEKKIFKTDMKLRTYTGEVIKPTGVAFVNCNYKNQFFYGKLYIINQQVDPIFGRSWMKEVKIELADMHMLQSMEPTRLDDLLEQYTDSVFKNDLGEIPNMKAHLYLKENSQPIFIKPRRIPYALKSKVDEEIERLCTQGIITKIDHSDWGTPIVPIVKPNGNIRLCADYKVTLNKVIKDEKYPIPIIEDIFAEMNGGQLFCTLDICQAYLNMVMDDESALLQTISTHKGTYKVNRLMFGVKVAPSLWQKFMDKLLQGIEGVKCFFDDIILQGSSEKELLKRLRQVLQKLKESNLRVNKEKCHFFKHKINYLGHTIDKDGLHKNKEKVKAITKTSSPKNVNELRTFLGMANYYNKFIPKLASITSPLNELLKKRTEFIWSSKCEESFNKVKEEILSERVLTHFDASKTLILATDASPTGLGAVLSHRLPDGSERPIAFASRSLTNSEKKYSQIDKEATSIYWGLRKFFHYCYGRKFTLVTDHKPLTSIFHPNQTLPALSTMRLFHYAHFLSGFDYEIEYRRSLNHSNADYLSRFPVENPKESSIDQHCAFQIQQINILEVRPNIIAQETKKDPELQQLLQHLRTGRSLRELGYKDNELTLQDECILKGTRIMIPQTLRLRVLDELHAGHMGTLKMKLLARSFVFWKNIDREIEDKVKSCRACRLQQNEPPKAPLHHWEEPTDQWQRIHIDFAGPISGQYLFILVDSFTKWVEVIPTKTTTSFWCIQKLKEIFCTFGIPNILVSDNGRQFTAQEFESFLKEIGVTHRTSAPYHPATNGQAERFVQTIKRALRAMEGESDCLNEKLLIIKNRLRRTPGRNGLTPYQLMFGRDVRTHLHVMFSDNPHKSNSGKDKFLTKVLRKFATGDRVQARNYSGHKKWKFGIILQRIGLLHYEVQTDDGVVWRRHIDQILPASRVPDPRMVAED